ncbi:MAG: uracil-DNA glycosylase [Chloroflexi bacterium]|nr:MAG: uracil-DNA glycosylase [Chloroflexota bacterium]
MQRKEGMSELETLADQIRKCTLCPLHQGRTQAVPGEGPEDAEIMFIGEAPGFHEDRQGRPFVGASGQFLDELLQSIGLDRAKVYITNVIKCRPPGNRDPLPEEIEACRPYLDRQLEIIRPKMVVTLGRFSMARYFPNARISRIHGKPKKIGGVLYYPMYHPAAALHQPSLRRTVEEDMKRIPELLARIDQIEEREEKPVEQAEQLSLF